MSTPVPTPDAHDGPLAALALTAGPRAGERLAVQRPVVTVGRAAGCDLVIDDDSVSARHARLAWEAGEWRITDLGSVNGTAVAGVTLAPEVPAPLPYGSTVRLGGVRLEFHEVVGADPDAARAGYVPPAAPSTLREERRGSRFPLWLLLLLVLLALLAAAFFLLGPDALVVATAAPGGRPGLALLGP